MSDNTKWTLPEGAEVVTYDQNCPSCMGMVAALARDLAELAALRAVAEAARGVYVRHTGVSFDDLASALAKYDALRKGGG